MSVNWAGTLTATSKNFEIPYPEKPGYDLVHSTLEGPEVGVYYRGHGTLSNGAATITLPEYFNRLVREGSETVLLTAQSEQPFMLSYDSFDFADNKFEVHGTIPNGEFDWQVNATRADLPPLQVEKKTPVAP